MSEPVIVDEDLGIAAHDLLCHPATGPGLVIVVEFAHSGITETHDL